MNFEKRYQNSQILFGISLLFLIGFLAVWLNNVYKNKVDELQTEVSYLWIKSIKSVEGSDFAKLIVTSINGTFDSLSMKTPHMLHSYPIIDEINLDSLYSSKFSIQRVDKKEEIQIILSSDSNFSSYNNSSFIHSQDTYFTEIGMEMDSPFAFKTRVETSIDSLDIDINFSNAHKKLLSNFALDMDLVTANLDSELTSLNLPIQYKVIDIGCTIEPFQKSSKAKKHHKDRFFVATATGNQYSLQISNYEGYIFQKMWLEFLMGTLLLVTISATFYYILNNLKEQNRLVTIKNDLISNITHELRTPIFTVSAALEALESFNGLSDPSRTKEYLSISKNELNRLSILVEKVLKTSLFEQEELQIKYESFSLNQLINTISNSLKLQLEKQQATLEVIVPETNMELYADKIHITNVIYNLIDNALKYSAARPPVITIQVQTIENNTQLVISDNGIGIPAAYLDEIFNKFFRVPQGNQHNVKGYGLGLNYVSNIIKQHQGSIQVTSQEGLGTTFTILLPKNSAV